MQFYSEKTMRYLIQCGHKQFLPYLKVLCTNRYCTEVKPETKSNPTLWRKPWAHKEGEWFSMFRLFAPEKGGSLEVIRILQNNINFSPQAIQKWIKKTKREASILDMKYIPERHDILGSNLAAAHFLVHRGAAIRFVGSTEWIKRQGDEYDLPNKYNPDYLVEAIDILDMKLYYEGFQNMTNLSSLQWLSLQNCVEVDDWFLDKISCEYQSSLEYLDIGNCVQVSHRGISALYRMSKLRTLKVHNIANSQMFQLACLMLEDIHPQLNIEGVTYLDSENQSV
ncbi:ATP synthase subunit s-like protein isoform X1 [Zootermopsis nevadensis]|uniref:ATP synthase subunit s-like protein isoform X1 n=1 Tax=Zootermopsis nevadensis TaxID=136037 RepID=UPI000B8E94A7|nr:ATP synthase subunit s-like protein isoform X1 [Zootermopsis nevadensis]